MAGAISGTTIAALVAMAASAAMTYKNNVDAAKRATEQTQRALERQTELQRQAEGKAMDQAKEFNTDDRASDQQAIEAQLTEEFAKPAEAAQTINAKGATTQGDVSSDYLTTKATSDANQMKMARTLAGLLGKTTGANRLRQNEAIDMANTAANIDRLGSFSKGQAGADEIAIQNAARPNAEMGLAASLIGTAGSAGLAYSGAQAAAAKAASVGGLGAGASTGLSGMNGVSGLRIPATFTW